MDGHDVIIAGGGPVGMGLAIELGQRGVSVCVVERHRDPQPIPKGQNLTPRTAEHFHFWGCEPELRAARPLPPEAGSGGVTCYKQLLTDDCYDWLNRSALRDYYFRLNERLPQYATEAVLRERAAALDSVRLLYGHSFSGLRQDSGGVTAEVVPTGGGEVMSLRGRYLVGCDGSHSAVRAAAGIAQTLTDHDRVMALVVFRSQNLDAMLAERFRDKAFFNVLHPQHEGYWLFFGRVDDRAQFFFHAPVPTGTSAENFDFAAYLQAAVGAKFDIAFDHIGFWDLRFAIADTYRAGRVFVAGDAAHSHPPYGGYGINTGFEDARNLGWKLAATVQGWAGPGLLDSYDAERRPVFASTARDFIDRFIREDRAFLARHDPERDRADFERHWFARNEGDDAVFGFAPHYEGSPLVAGGSGQSGAAGGHDFRARAGHHLAPLPLADGGDIYDRLGPDFTLLAFGAADGDVAALRDAAGRQGLPLRVVRGPAESRYGARLVLVRPDHYVAWAGEGTAQEAAALIARVAGNLEMQHEAG